MKRERKMNKEIVVDQIHLLMGRAAQVGAAYKAWTYVHS